jgi:ubiquinone/menaquinone biosynthesis C-methylase UbiE
MNQFEKDYYDYDGFWNDEEKSLKNNIEKIQITMSFIKDDVQSVLDAACGNGIFTNYLVKQRPDLKVVGFDRSEQALKYVKAEKFVASIDQIPMPDKSFDCVIAHDVIEHLPVEAYEKALGELSRIAKKYIIIGVPFCEKIEENTTRCPSCRSVFNYDLHLRSFNDATLKYLFQRFGFSNKVIRSCHKVSYFLGQKMYTRYFHPEIYNKFRSPICPICGYRNEQLVKENSLIANSVEQNGEVSQKKGLKSIIRMLWPKNSFNYEVVALYERNLH